MSRRNLSSRMLRAIERTVCGLIVTGLAGSVVAQPPQAPAGQVPEASPVARLIQLDANGDGSISSDEVQDERLKELFSRADADRDGVVTKAEIAALQANLPPGAGRGRMRRGPEGGEFPGGPGEGGPGFRGGFGPSPLGQILPLFIRGALGLSDEQNKEIDALQQEVNAKLKKILTADQHKAFENMVQNPPGRGPRGEGGPGGGRFGESGPPANSEEVVNRLLEQDKNGDGKLSKDELPERMQRIIQRADTDGDGLVTKEELAKALGGQQRPRGEEGRPERNPE